MDDLSYEEFNKGKNGFVGLLVLGLIILGLALGVFTTFRQETLVCNAQSDICYVQKTNFAGYDLLYGNHSEKKGIDFQSLSVLAQGSETAFLYF